MVHYPIGNPAMKFPVALFALLLVTACAASPNAAQPTTQQDPALPKPAASAQSASESPAMPELDTPAPDRISATGTVRHQNLEGGFWGIIADDGRRFDPMGLDAEFQKEGLRVRFEATPETDMMSTRMWGTMVTLTKIEPIE
jgi:hypothetical protein